MNVLKGLTLSINFDYALISRRSTTKFERQIVLDHFRGTSKATLIVNGL